MKTKIAKCEQCGKEVEYKGTWPGDMWSKCGASKHGKKYLKTGIAWWCPDHQK